jgi:hypothetical protein
MKEINLGISILALAATIVMIIIPSIDSTHAQSTESSAIGGITNPTTTAASSGNKTFYLFTTAEPLLLLLY